MSYLIKPANYKALLDLKQTELGIKQIKEFFQQNLSSELRLRRVTAPLFVLKGMGINDDLSGTERAVRNSNRTNRQKALDNPNNKRAVALLKKLVQEEKSLSEMARILNKEGFVTARGCQFRASQVNILIKRYNLK